MIVLSIDTCDPRGSVAVVTDETVRSIRVHSFDDYSSWLLPATAAALGEAGWAWSSLDLLAVATGPGSFTGVRVGLTAVKAWAEVYAKPVVGVSRLEALASLASHAEWVAATFDAHRGQVFAALYRRCAHGLEAVEPGLVITATALVSLVTEKAGTALVEWVTLDPDVLRSSDNWSERARFGDLVTPCSGSLAVPIARMAAERAKRGEFTDTLALDANYVRRSDAEIFWKGPAHVG